VNPIEQYIETKDPSIRDILDLLRHFILSFDPAMKEKIAYGIPFFYIHKNICYLNPVRNGVDIGFTQGLRLDLNLVGFELKNRKMVKTLHYKRVDEIDFEAVGLILEKALLLDRPTIDPNE
jgi:hypothetical protein